MLVVICTLHTQKVHCFKQGIRQEKEIKGIQIEQSQIICLQTKTILCLGSKDSIRTLLDLRNTLTEVSGYKNQHIKVSSGSTRWLSL